MIGMLSWMAMYVLERTGHWGVVLELLLVCESNWNVSSIGEWVETLRVRIKGQANMGDTIVRCLVQVEVDGSFCGQLEVISQLRALVLLEDFEHPNISWKDNMTQHTQSKKLLQTTEDNFLM